MTTNHGHKTVQALLYFCNEAHKTDSLGSLRRSTATAWLFFADIAHLCTYGRTISGDSYMRTAIGFDLVGTRKLLDNTYGYVNTPDVTYSRKYLNVTPDDIRARSDDQDLDEFSESDIQMLTSVYFAYHRFPIAQLHDIMRTFPGWRRARINSIVPPGFFLANASDRAKERFNSAHVLNSNNYTW